MKQQTFRAIWISVLVILVVWIAWRTLVPLGTLSYFTDLTKSNYIFEDLLPAERVTDKRIIIDEPVYFTVYTPRKFDTAIVTMHFVDEAPAFALGVAHNRAQWIYDFKPVTENSREFTLEFDLRSAERRKGRYSFMISNPEIQKQLKKINIENIKVQFIGPLL